jgi:hypothetical protein
MTMLATRIRENKALYVAAGAGDFAVEKFRELPDTVAKLRETATKYQGELKDNVQKARSDVRGTVAKYQDEFKGNVTKIQERVDTKEIPGVAVSYMTHAGTRVVEFVDALAARGEKVVNKTEAVTDEIEAGAKETARKAKTAASETKKTAQASAKKAENTAKS